MDGSKIKLCGTPPRVPRQVHWLFDEINSKEEGDGAIWENSARNSEEEMEHQQSTPSSMDVVERMDMPSYSVIESFVDGNKSYTASSSFMFSSNAAVDSVSERGNAGIVVEDRECNLETTCSVGVVQSEPASTVTPLEKQQYLQNIVDNVSSLFPDLAFVLGFDGLDRSNPF